MCQVDSFCCGCAPLRKGALIIGSVKLVMMMLAMMAMMTSVMMMITIMRMIPLGQSVIPPFDASDDDDLMIIIQ